MRTIDACRKGRSEPQSAKFGSCKPRWIGCSQPGEQAWLEPLCTGHVHAPHQWLSAVARAHTKAGPGSRAEGRLSQPLFWVKQSRLC